MMDSSRNNQLVPTTATTKEEEQEGKLVRPKTAMSNGGDSLPMVLQSRRGSTGSRPMKQRSDDRIKTSSKKDTVLRWSDRGPSQQKRSRSYRSIRMPESHHHPTANATFMGVPSANVAPFSQRTDRLHSTQRLENLDQQGNQRGAHLPTPLKSRLRSFDSTPNMLQSQILTGSSHGNHGSNDPSGCHSSSKVMMQLAQRSNGGAIKAVLAKLRGMTEPDSGKVSALSSTELPLPPSQDLALLAQCASADIYYKIIIAKYDGIRTIVKIMEMYPQDLDIQVSGLSTLSELTNKASIHEHGGVSVCLRALTNFPDSIEILSAGLHMLKMQASELTTEPHKSLCLIRPIVEASERMLDLTASGKEGLIFMKRFLDTYQIGMEG